MSGYLFSRNCPVELELFLLSPVNLVAAGRDCKRLRDWLFLVGDTFLLKPVLLRLESRRSLEPMLLGRDFAVPGLVNLSGEREKVAFFLISWRRSPT